MGARRRGIRHGGPGMGAPCMDAPPNSALPGARAPKAARRCRQKGAPGCANTRGRAGPVAAAIL
ncbi:MAG: hypothetical protein Kow0058_07250 [Roseovarius sp.]